MSFSITESREMSPSVFYADEFVRSSETSLTADLCMQMHAHRYMTCPAFLLLVVKHQLIMREETQFAAEDSKLHPRRQILDLHQE